MNANQQVIAHWSGKVRDAVADARTLQGNLDTISASAALVKDTLDAEIKATELAVESSEKHSLSRQLAAQKTSEIRDSPAYRLCELIAKLNPPPEA